MKFFFCGILAMMLTTSLSFAHEVPSRVQIKFLIQQNESDLQMLVRLPLESMRDYDFVTNDTGYLNFSESLPLIEEAVQLWVLDEIDIYQGDKIIEKTHSSIRISLPTSMNFDNFDEALVQFNSPALTNDITLFWRQALVDIHVKFELTNHKNIIKISPKLARLGQKTLSIMKFSTLNGDVYQFDYKGDPGLISLNPSKTYVLTKFIREGFIHILSGKDHLLFLIALVAPLWGLRRLIYVISAFTVGHSLTLIFATLGYIPNTLWFPIAVELFIALSILILVIDNVLKRENHYRWLFGLVFGLVHGLGFSFTLTQSLQYSGQHLSMGILGFNLGVEFGQLLLLTLVLPLFHLIRQYSRQEYLFLIIISLFIAHTSLHWLQDHWIKLEPYIDLVTQ